MPSKCNYIKYRHMLDQRPLLFNCHLSQLWPINEVWNQLISSATAAFFSQLLKAFKFLGGSRFCPLARVKTFLATSDFTWYYFDLDFIERGSVSEAHRADVWCHNRVLHSGLSTFSCDYKNCILIWKKGHFKIFVRGLCLQPSDL